jgi:hypothetical protein
MTAEAASTEPARAAAAVGVSGFPGADGLDGAFKAERDYQVFALAL